MRSFVGDARENLNRFIDDLRVLIELRKNQSEVKFELYKQEGVNLWQNSKELTPTHP